LQYYLFPKGEDKMKITKEYLKELIKEELESVLVETSFWDIKSTGDMPDTEEGLKALIDKGNKYNLEKGKYDQEDKKHIQWVVSNATGKLKKVKEKKKED
jgi:hypothetical protein